MRGTQADGGVKVLGACGNDGPWQEEDQHVYGGMEGWVDGLESMLVTYKMWEVVMADEDN